MPEHMGTYLTALLYCTEVSTCMAIAQALDNASPDRLTRMLKGRWSGQTLLDVALRALCTVMGGELLIDATIGEKPYAALLEEAVWVWSTKHNEVVFGMPVVLLVWTNGQGRIPLACRIWQQGGPATFDVALAVLSYARHRLRVHPRVVLGDAWYPSKPVLQRLRDYGWDCGCQVKKHRRFEVKPVRAYQRQPDWQAVGKLSEGIKVRVVHYRRKSYVTNRLSLTAQEVRAIDTRRHAIEEVCTFLTAQLSLAACQAGYPRLGNEASQVAEGVQAHPMALCLVAYGIVERERIKHGITLRPLKRPLIVRGLKLSWPSLKRVRMAA
jgi:hypothetical protein